MSPSLWSGRSYPDPEQICSLAPEKVPTENADTRENGGGGNRTHETIPTDKKPWPRGRCEFWTSDRSMCGKKGRWMVSNEIRCGEHSK